MARKPRTDYPGAWHHVMHRGARRSPVFRDDDDCLRFLAILEEAVQRFGIEVHAYALMPNHYHLLVRSVQGNLSAAMRLVNAAYTQGTNIAHGWDGPLFRGRFHSQLLRNEEHLMVVFAYIHLNPLRAHLVSRLESPSWTSYRAYVERDRAPDWLTRGVFLTACGGKDGLAQFVLDLQRGRRPWPESLAPDTGWIRLEGDDTHRPRAAPSGGKGAQVKRAKAALETVYRITGVTLRDLRHVERGPRANPGRRFAVWALRRGTLLTQREIGVSLRMSTIQVGNVLQRQTMTEEPFLTWKHTWDNTTRDK